MKVIENPALMSDADLSSRLFNALDYRGKSKEQNEHIDYLCVEVLRHKEMTFYRYDLEWLKATGAAASQHVDQRERQIKFLLTSGY